MYFYRLISAVAFVSMVLSAAVPSPGSPTGDGPQLLSKNGATIEVTFPGHSADSKWTKTTQNDAQVGVVNTLRDAWKEYHLQNVTSKYVKFHGFVSKAQVIRPSFGADCYFFGADCHLFKVKFSGALAHIGECEGWVVVDLRDRPGAEKAIVSGEIRSIAGEGISSMRSMRYNSEDFKEGKWITIGYYRWKEGWKEVVTMD
ncbi:hypothetical protein EV359DRAFT_67383 [Lentinula novae-zelandiae]|nr:hypothetical protein EV359DRAFT_67383 [Lentinula novae-zelandiae]